MKQRRTLLAVTAAVALTLSGVGMASAATTDPNPSDREKANAAVSRQAATEGMVLLENEGGLPIAKTGNIALFGVGAYATVKGGTGSGDVNNRYTVPIREGFESAGYNITTDPDYWAAMKDATDNLSGSGGGPFAPPKDYSKGEVALTPQTVRPMAPTDTAVYVIARNSGEFADRTKGEGDYEMGTTELHNIKMLGAQYKNVIVALNTGGMMDTTFYKTVNEEVTDPAGGLALDALILVSQPGQEAGHAIVDVLNGTVNPSGHLTDTWASKYEYYPASATFGVNDGNSKVEVYEESIYVGYRYFDSFYKTINPADPESVVNYPFGYGLSYTMFETATNSVSVANGEVTVKATVTNVGEVAGKEVVQVYASAPASTIDTPYQVLVGFAKTDLLQPSQSQQLTIKFDAENMASYDVEASAFVLMPGEYILRVGNGSRSTDVAARLSVGKWTIIDQLSEQLDDKGLDVKVSNRADFYTYPEEAVQIAAAPVVPVTGIVSRNSVSPYSQDIPVPEDSPFYKLDGSLMGSTKAFIDPSQTEWENTGAPYKAKLGEEIIPTTVVPGSTLFDVYKGDVTMEQFVAGLDVNTMAYIIEGTPRGGQTLNAPGSAGFTNEFADLGIPAMTATDGPAGLRVSKEIAGSPTNYQFATAFPIGTALAQTWNTELVQKVGEAIGEEMIELGATLWLAPGMNIHRDPLCGRNFEYYSEDPLVSGIIAARTSLGVQSSPGVGVTVKHYAGNQQEKDRSQGESTIPERALREVYLKGFEIVVKAAEPLAVMSSYNAVNGTFAGSNYDLLTDVLRGEWGYKGMVMTDWGAISYLTVSGATYAGNDLVMPGNSPQSVVNSILTVPPTFDVFGLPEYDVRDNRGTDRYTWSLGGLTLAAAGTQTISTTVNASSDLSDPKSHRTIVDAINNETYEYLPPFPNVNAAYEFVQQLLAGNAFTAAQKAAISVTDVVRDGTDGPVTSYKVTLKGNYGDSVAKPLRLGDLQRATSRVLNTAMHSADFGRLADLKGVEGIVIKPYSSLFDNLHFAMSGTVGKVDAPVGANVERIAGSSRYATNLAVNAKTMKTGAPVFVATGASYPDALSVAPAVRAENGSLVLVGKNKVDQGTLDLLKEKKPSAVYVIGGNNAISSAVVTQLKSATGVNPQRISGSSRYETSERIFNKFFATKDINGVFIATGRAFPDALSASAAGGALNMPVLLVDGKTAKTLPASIASTLSTKTSNVQIIGGTGAVNATLNANLSRSYEVGRISGANRFETNMAVNNYVTSKVGGASLKGVWVATGLNFPDALSASVPAGNATQRLVLSNGKCLPKPVVSGWIKADGSKVSNVTLVGGTGALAQSVFALDECK